jgi:hypothetical protein
MRDPNLSVVRNTRNKPEAVVFPGNGGFYFMDVRTAAMPVGPFATRQRAEESADINVEIDREIDAMLTPMVGVRRSLR